MLESLLRRELLTEDGTQAISAKLDVQKLKQALSARDWCLLEGKYNGYSQEELGIQLGVAPDSVRSLLSRARKNATGILSARNSFYFVNVIDIMEGNPKLFYEEHISRE